MFIYFGLKKYYSTILRLSIFNVDNDSDFYKLK